MPFIAPSRRAARRSFSPTTASASPASLGSPLASPPQDSTREPLPVPFIASWSSTVTQLGESMFQTGGQDAVPADNGTAPSASSLLHSTHDIALLLPAASLIDDSTKIDRDITVEVMADVLLQVKRPQLSQSRYKIVNIHRMTNAVLFAAPVAKHFVDARWPLPYHSPFFSCHFPASKSFRITTTIVFARLVRIWSCAVSRGIGAKSRASLNNCPHLCVFFDASCCNLWL
jgi:hypothetical protein